MFASLASNDEEIRKRIVDSAGLMSDLLAAVEGDCPGLQLAALRCLLSLSRSVQMLRTAMQVRRGPSCGICLAGSQFWSRPVPTPAAVLVMSGPGPVRSMSGPARLLRRRGRDLSPAGAADWPVVTGRPCERVGR